MSPDKTKERLKAIDDAADRMTVKVKELHTKIGDTPPAVQEVDLADLTGLCLKETPVPKGVKTQLIVGAGLGSVMLDPLKMQRALDDLVKNRLVRLLPFHSSPEQVYGYYQYGDCQK
jgi:hypothetical protein